MFKPLFRMLTIKRKLSVLMYHQVLPEHDFMRPDEITAAIFQQHLQHLTSNFTLLTLTDALDKLSSGTLPPNAAVMTFDDGYENNASIALPMLQQFGVPATFYIATDFLNGGAMWNDKVLEAVRRWSGKSIQTTIAGQDYKLAISDDESRSRAGGELLKIFKYLPLAQRSDAVDKFAGSLIEDLTYMMSDAQVRDLFDAGMEIGGHTCSHPILASLPESLAYQQIVTNKSYLEGIVGQPLTSFAYPNGKPRKDYTAETVDLVRRAGYQYAVSTHQGVADNLTDKLQVPRFTPWRNDKVGFLSLLAKNYLSGDPVNV